MYEMKELWKHRKQMNAKSLCNHAFENDYFIFYMYVYRQLQWRVKKKLQQGLTQANKSIAGNFEKRKYKRKFNLDAIF